MAIFFVAVASGCAVDQRRHVPGDVLPTIISGPAFVATRNGPIRDLDGDGVKDTYGPTEIVTIRVRFSQQEVCGEGTLALTLRTGAERPMRRTARYCGCGPDHIDFCYAVQSGDRDADGLGIDANAISFRTYDGVVPNATHQPVAPNPGHIVDGRLPDISPPRLDSAPGIHAGPANGTTYRRGETIWIEAIFTETVVIDTGGGRPTLAIEIGDELRHAVYHADEPGRYHRHRVYFAYRVRPGDRDDDGMVWVPAAGGLRVPEGSSITDLAGNHASLERKVSAGSRAHVHGG